MKRAAKQTPRGREGAEGQRGFAPALAAFANDRHVSRRRMFSSDNVLSVNREGRMAKREVYNSSYLYSQ